MRVDQANGGADKFSQLFRQVRVGRAVELCRPPHFQWLQYLSLESGTVDEMMLLTLAQLSALTQQ